MHVFYTHPKTINSLGMLKMLAVVNRATTMSNTPNKKLHHRRWVGGCKRLSFLQKFCAESPPQKKNPRPLCNVSMEEREREAVFTYVEVPILMRSPEGLGIYPWVAFPQGKEILVLFLYVLVFHQGKKKRSRFYVCGGRDWVTYGFSSGLGTPSSGVFSGERTHTGNLPSNIICSGPLLVGAT